YTAAERAEDITIDRRIRIMIENGIVRLRKSAPDLTVKDFEEEGDARALLFDYCRYADSNATEMFGVNYAAEILALRLDYKARSAKNENQEQS
ncbi:MAG: hypothetical protein Q3989_08630, partial [Eubacteriales bacterium]|nr:hypothetical protein [Eubacteriales bacterium]